MFKDENSSPDTLEFEHNGCNVIQWASEYINLINERSGALAEYFPNASEIREISIVWGPAVDERNYRVTYGTPGNYHVSDWLIGWDVVDRNTIVFADEYNVIM